MNVSKGSAPWGLLVAAVFFAALGIAIYVLYDRMPEVVSSVDDSYDLIQNLNELGGKLAVAGFFGLFAVGFGAWGLYRLAARRRASAMPLTMTASQLNTALQVALAFTENDLRANQSGQLTEKQKQVLGKVYRQNRWLVFGMLLFIVLLIGGILVFIFYFSPGADLNRKSLLETPDARLALGIFGGLIALILGATLIRALTTRPPDQLRIEEGEGEVRLTMTGSRYGTVCRLRLNRKQFYLTEPQARGFWNGGRYRLYYVHWTSIPTIISGEYLG